MNLWDEDVAAKIESEETEKEIACNTTKDRPELTRMRRLAGIFVQ